MLTLHLQSFTKQRILIFGERHENFASVWSMLFGVFALTSGPAAYLIIYMTLCGINASHYQDEFVRFT